MASLARTCALQRLCAVRTPQPFFRISSVSVWGRNNNLKTNWFHSGSQDATHRWTPQQKRILYRSKQRGWVELDLILSAFSETRIASMSHEELSELEKILNEENVVLYGCLVGNNGVYDSPPDQIKNLKLFKEMQKFVKNEYPKIVATNKEKGGSQP